MVRLLGFGHLMVGSGSPDAVRAYQWIVKNQNSDGGWGSFLGQPSRVWLTAMAIRALVEINLNDPCVASGVEWLCASRDPSTSAWGEVPQGSATVTHTAFVLTCLVESRTGGQRAHVDEAIRKGFHWLQTHVDTAAIYDDTARVESYNVSYIKGQRTVTWQNSVWHPSLPFVLAALVRHPAGADPNLIVAAVHKIVNSQSADGRWPNADGAAGISVWSVWPFIDALSDFLQKTPVRGADRVTWLSSNSIMIRRGSDASKSLARLSWSSGISAGKTLLKRHWATTLLGLTLIFGAILTIFGVLEIKDSALALALPVFLVVVQEFIARTRSSATS